MQVLAGVLIDDRYRVDKKLGEGGMSSVYKVFDTRLKKIWAMKFIEVNDISGGMTEASVLRNLEHPLLPRVVDVGHFETGEGRYIYMVMDFIEGRNLEEVLREEGSISEEQCVLWIMDILDALKYLHSQSPPVIYRDMKPGNVMLTRDGKLKIIDFGIAREKKVGRVSDTVALGTRGYAAPEQFGGQGQSDERTDIYCLGATMYHLITGKSPCEPPYRMYPVRHVKPGLSENIEKIILIATKSDPNKRFQSCQAMMDAIKSKDMAVDGKRILRLYASSVLMLLGIWLLISSIPLGLFSRRAIADEYDYYLNQSVITSAYSDRIGLITEAIRKNPSKLTGYEYLADLFAEDKIFSESEEMLILRLWEDCGSSRLTKDDRSILSYRIGMLYWLYYSYGRDSELNIKQSISWFQEASKSQIEEYRNIANIYYLIGIFHRDVAGKTDIEGDVYLEYFANLEKLISLVTSDHYKNHEEQVEIASFVEKSIESYYEDFIYAGVVEERVINLLESTKNI